MTGERRLSQAISEGDGISLIVPVADPEEARAAQTGGAEGLLASSDIPDLRAVTTLPVLRRSANGEADALVLPADGDADELAERYATFVERGIECVIEVREVDQLQVALERLDAEIFLLSPATGDQGEAAVEHVLDLLADVPAGKLAIAGLDVTSREEIAELERMGFDAVIVGTRDVAPLAGAAPPEV